MKKYYFSSLFVISPVMAQTVNLPEQIQNIAKPELRTEEVKELENQPQPNRLMVSENTPIDLAELLNQAIFARRFDLVKPLLAQYKQSENPDPLLILFAQGAMAYVEQNYTEAIIQFRQLLAIDPNLNPARIELAKAYFFARQDNNAKQQFQQARSAENIPAVVVELIDQYLAAIAQRDEWQFYVNGYYIRDKNVNNVSSNPRIENTGFIKNSNMLPQKAHGIGYHFGLEKDFNLINAHYLHFSSQLDGKLYWDNHDYDDIYQRNYLGYQYKSANHTVSLLPFYERRWYGGHRYQWGNGVRAEYQHWLSNRWQLSSAMEYTKQRYFASQDQNGQTKLFSTTLLWQYNPQQFFYFGVDFNREKTREKQYSSDTKTIRMGWGKEWQYAISSRIHFSFSDRKFKDKAVLGSILPLGKIRHDHIYAANLTLWKRDWHLWNITPKLNFSWKKQKSNIDSMYSYSEKEIKVFFERSF